MNRIRLQHQLYFDYVFTNYIFQHLLAITLMETVRTNKDGHPQAKDVRLMDGSVPGPYPEDDGDAAGDTKGCLVPRAL